MGNLEITNIDNGNVILKDPAFRDDPLVFAGAGTVVEGTILARDSVSLKLVPYVKAGVVNENGIPKGVITYDVVALGAGDEQIRMMISGSVRKERLIIDADGDGSNIDDKVLDQLRDFNIDAIDVKELNIQDNQ